MEQHQPTKQVQLQSDTNVGRNRSVEYDWMGWGEGGELGSGGDQPTPKIVQEMNCMNQLVGVQSKSDILQYDDLKIFIVF